MGPSRCQGAGYLHINDGVHSIELERCFFITWKTPSYYTGLLAEISHPGDSPSFTTRELSLFGRLVILTQQGLFWTQMRRVFVGASPHELVRWPSFTTPGPVPVPEPSTIIGCKSSSGGVDVL